MNMNEPLALLWASIAGLTFGAIFFGGLWWTVRRGAASRRPALWFAASLLLRLTVVLGGIYLVAGSHWERLLVCLIGFTAARLAATRLMRPLGKFCSDPAVVAREGEHAP